VILQALYELAQRENLGGHFRDEVVHLIAEIDDDGRLLTLIPTAGEDGRARRMLVPLRQQRSGTRPPPCFLVDNALYVLGIADPGDARKQASAPERTAAYAEFLREVIGDDTDPGQLLQSGSARASTRTARSRWLCYRATNGAEASGSRSAWQATKPRRFTYVPQRSRRGLADGPALGSTSERPLVALSLAYPVR
jgi:hypothetical protein